MFWRSLFNRFFPACLPMWIQQVGASEQRRRLGSVTSNFTSPVSVTATIPAVGAVIGGIADTSAVQVGMLVVQASGTPYLPAGPTFVVSKTSSTVTLSQDPTNGSAESYDMYLIGGGTSYVHLWQSPYVGGLDPLPAGFTEATFTGYTSLAVQTPSATYTTGSGGAESSLGSYSWVLTSTPATVNAAIGGYWVDYIPAGATDPVVSFWEAFAVPLPMSNTGNAINFALPIDLPNPGSASPF